MSESQLFIHTDRLLLREVEESDFSAVHDYARDAEVSRYMPWGPNSEQDTKEFIQRVLDHQRKQPRSEYDFALVKKDDIYLIGICSLVVRNTTNSEGEIGYVLNRNYWNQGYTTEASKAVLSFGFDKLKMHRIYATCNPVNIASSRVMEKIGMRREGYLKEHRLTKGEWCDSLLYAILDREFENIKTTIKYSKE